MFNYFKTSVLMASIMALFAVVGFSIGGQQGMLLALGFAAVGNFLSYWFSASMVLAMYRAKEVDAASAPQIYCTVQDLARKANLPMPKVYFIEEDTPNAFATGRNPEHAAVAFTTGLLKSLSQRELQGVIAHELAHIKHRDILIATISATMAGAISALANIALFFGGSRDQERSNPIASIFLAILAPIAAMLIQMAISRAREYQADHLGAKLSGDPEGLALALEKLEYYAQHQSFATAQIHPETAQMMIVNPLTGRSFAELFATHPRTAERVARLRQMAAQGVYTQSI